MDGRRLINRVWVEVEGVDLRAVAATLLTLPLPTGAMHHARAYILRACGIRVGRGTIVAGTIRISGGRMASRNLAFGRECYINVGCLFDAASRISVGDRVAIGHRVMMITSSHDPSHPKRRGGEGESMPIEVGAGAWISAGAIILP